MSNTHLFGRLIKICGIALQTVAEQAKQGRPTPERSPIPANRPNKQGQTNREKTEKKNRTGGGDETE